MSIIIEADVTLPIRITMPRLTPDGEPAFVERCMAQPGNCDNDWSEAQNRAWFKEMWRQQVSFQAALLANPELLTGFIGYLALDPLSGGGLMDGHYLSAATPSIDDVAEPIAAAIGQEDHFSPPIEYGVDTYTMLGEILGAAKVEMRGAPVIAEAKQIAG